MNIIINIIFAIFLAIATGVNSANATNISIDLKYDKNNPITPTMGDWMYFHSAILNLSDKPINGLVAWISLIEVTPGKEQPMDLEDWSAHKAVSGATLSPGSMLNTKWPVRLIQSGDYRVVISVTEQNEHTVYTSPTLQFHITRKPVIQSSRILPVALGIPLIIVCFMFYRLWKQRRHS